MAFGDTMSTIGEIERKLEAAFNSGWGNLEECLGEYTRMHDMQNCDNGCPLKRDCRLIEKRGGWVVR